MMKFLLGLLAGIVLLVLFFYFGGPKYVTSFGAKTEAAGERLEQYEKKLKETGKHAEKAVKKSAGEAKESVEKTYDKTRDKVKNLTD